MEPAVIRLGREWQDGVLFNLTDPVDIEMLRAARNLLWYAGRRPRPSELVLLRFGL